MAGFVGTSGCAAESLAPTMGSAESLARGSAALLVTQPPQYSFTVAEVLCLNPRSTSTDTDYVQVNMTVPTTPGGGGSYGIGDLSADHAYAMPISTPFVSVAPASYASFHYEVWNGTGGGTCDGLVASGDLTYSSDELDYLTGETGFRWLGTFPWTGSSSPVICGEASHYEVSVSVTRQDPARPYTQPFQDAITFSDGDARLVKPILGGFVYPDWDFGSYKAECPGFMGATGLSKFTQFGAAHDLFCRETSNDGASFTGTGTQTCHAMSFTSGDARGTTSTGDWAPGSYKGECAENEVVAGVAQTPQGTVNAVLCCPGQVAHGNCSAMPFERSDAREWSDPTDDDWDPGYFKGECGPNRYVAGVSRNATTSGVHSILCCDE
jgi:hypothetical protein